MASEGKYRGKYLTIAESKYIGKLNDSQRVSIKVSLTLSESKYKGKLNTLRE